MGRKKKGKKKFIRQDLFPTVFKCLLFFGLLVFLGVTYAWQHTQISRVGVSIGRKEKVLARLVKENEKLRMRIEALTAPKNIEKELKRHKLKMVVPSNDQIVYLTEPKGYL